MFYPMDFLYAETIMPLSNREESLIVTTSKFSCYSFDFSFSLMTVGVKYPSFSCAQ